jgi:IS5 family transposase
MHQSKKGNDWHFGLKAHIAYSGERDHSFRRT